MLGIRRRDGTYLGAPRADTEIQAFDTLVLYGPLKRLQELDERRSGRRGDRAHEEAKFEQAQLVQREMEADLARTD